MPTIRWSIWGPKRHLCDLLRRSIGGFHRAFDSRAHYVVSTDEPSELATVLPQYVKLIPFDDSMPSPFNVRSCATWKKWCPRPKLTLESTELLVDADVFLVGEPDELCHFCLRETKYAVLAMQEETPLRALFGRLNPRVPANAPPINAGIVGQRAGVDLGVALLRELGWWTDNVDPTAQTHFDEQGALAAVLTPWSERDQLWLLPRDRYRIVSPRSNASLRTLGGTVAIHATQPHHPAFRRFYADIDAFSSASHVESAIDAGKQGAGPHRPPDVS